MAFIFVQENTKDIIVKMSLKYKQLFKFIISRNLNFTFNIFINLYSSFILLFLSYILYCRMKHLLNKNHFFNQYRF